MHEDDRPLPEWKAASIIEHLTKHNTDPEVQTWVRLIEIQEMIIDEIQENEKKLRREISQEDLEVFLKVLKQIKKNLEG